MDVGQQPAAKDYNWWLEYNNTTGAPLPPATAADILAHYRRHPPPPRPLPALPPLGRLQGPALPIIPSPAIDVAKETERLQVFLDAAGTVPPELEQAAARAPLLPNWTGVKILGEGTSGIVGLFEYNALAPGQPQDKQVVVKQLKPPPVVPAGVDPADVDYGNKPADSLYYEAILMDNLRGVSFSDHIVRHLMSDASFDELNDDVIDQRLVMEYCPQGSLYDLLGRRVARNLPFQELTLWRLFECMVDACSVLEFGQELTFGRHPATGAQQVIVNPTTTPDGRPWDVYVHSDIKPHNVFLGNRNRVHTRTPVCKLGDFGSTSVLNFGDEDPQIIDEKNEEIRQWGTPGYYTPEQFTPRWNDSDWRDTGVAGVYGSTMNIWGIGAIMYQLTCLDSAPPDHLLPFTPAYPINGAPAKGITYGYNIEAQNYSDTLKHMILECLYEKPADRCNLQDMKLLITQTIEAIIDIDGPDGDDWADLEVPEPGGQVVYPMDDTVLRCDWIYPVGHVRAGLRCRNRRKQTQGPRVRCATHVAPRYP